MVYCLCSYFTCNLLTNCYSCGLFCRGGNWICFSLDCECHRLWSYSQSKSHQRPVSNCPCCVIHKTTAHHVNKTGQRKQPTWRDKNSQINETPTYICMHFKWPLRSPGHLRKAQGQEHELSSTYWSKIRSQKTNTDQLTKTWHSLINDIILQLLGSKTDTNREYELLIPLPPWTRKYPKV